MPFNSSLKKTEVSEVSLCKLLRKASSLEDLCNSGFNIDHYISIQLCFPGAGPDDSHVLHNNETHQNSPSPKGEHCYLSQVSCSPKCIKRLFLSGFEGEWKEENLQLSSFELENSESNQRITSQNIVAALKQQKTQSIEWVAKLRQKFRVQSQPAEVLSSCIPEEPPSVC